MIGAGIFIMLGIALSFTGYSLPLATIIGMIYINLTTLYAFIIVSFVPMKGGMYGQYALVLPPVLVGVMSVSSLVGGFTYSGFGTGIVDYIGAVFPGVLPYKKIIAIAIIALAYLLSMRETKLIGKIQNVMTVVLLAALGLFIVVGLTKVDFGLLSPSNEGWLLNGGAGLVSASAMMGFACNGAVMTVSFAAQTKDARHTIPKWSLIAIVAVGITYVLMCIVAVGVLPIEQVAGQNLDVVARAIFSTPLFNLFVIGGGAFALLTSLFGGVASMRFVLEAIAKDGWMPPALNKTNKDGFPYMLVLLNFICSVVPILFDISFDNIISMISLPGIPVMLVATIACFSFPKKYPELWKNSFFHMPMPCYYGLLSLCTVAAIYYLYSYLTTLSAQYYLMAGILTVALYGIAYFRIKSGAVDKQRFIDAKEAAIAEVMAAEKLTDATT